MAVGQLANVLSRKPAQPEFGKAELNGRRVYLCGFQHGVGVFRPLGGEPLEATRRLFARESPYLMIEGINTQKKARRHLKCREFLSGEDVEKHLFTVVKEPRFREQLKQLVGRDPVKMLSFFRLGAAAASPFFWLSTSQRRKLRLIYEGSTPVLLREQVQRMEAEREQAFRCSHTLCKFSYIFGPFRSFLMADAIRQRHAALPKNIPFALFHGEGHSLEIEAFLTNPKLFNGFLEGLPPILRRIYRKVHELNQRTIAAYLSEGAPHSGIRMSKHAAAVLRQRGIKVGK